MKTDFKKMENEMELLTENMNSITSFSEQISSTLQVNEFLEQDVSSTHFLPTVLTTKLGYVLTVPCVIYKTY